MNAYSSQQQRGAANTPAVRQQPDLRAPDIAMFDMRGPQIGGVVIVPQSLKEIVDFAALMASSRTAVRKHLRDNPGACFSVAMLAFRTGMDPFALANKSYEVNDQIAYEAQAVAAIIIKNAPIVDRPEYSYSGTGQSRRCTVTVTAKSGKAYSYESPELKDINPKNSPLWKTDPDQQLGYYSVRALARRHFPDVIMGVYDVDEAESMRDVTPALGQPIDIRPEEKGRKSKPTDALDRLQARRAPKEHIKTVEADPGPNVQEETAPAAEEVAPQADEVDAGDPPHDSDGVISDEPVLPEAALGEWEGKGKWYPAFQWIEQQAETLPPPTLAALLARHEDILEAATKRSEEGAARVAALKEKASQE
ncbi:conserved hypothetical protein [uncultured Pleomorphomonas sp.]|uniref:RecT family protein n=1 Tax=uncultured Pleomorphomonas sp. TaxID=442121 RepID=A0A212L293_9HYPH|nr:recombinase RecT [uncultured Pleomorphomonas sp.]SCM71665.1 conserved hypothetical protein [uncultured Pleomorphomonas sp.]